MIELLRYLEANGFTNDIASGDDRDFMRPVTDALRLLVLHDDAEREFDCVPGAERSLERAQAEGWTVVSIKNDWATDFADVA